ncbi:type II and III secretion system protein [Candidatus Koribacter versatilis Ellin345]|uniref:Type II and III secretion system protein n=1 Tax=Koribacter versatilis (strain Ellin345) TaxID=204669 RepID=Q1IRM5_KORVE|nr:type IV pilus secretin family protein [Candidatus Koribacter versatilis]ABF40475.1 type II and III secretion system protein [Candidatus Koribacter versatilis Ellin345]
MRLKQLLGVSVTLLALAGAAAAAGSQLTNVNVASEGTSTVVTLHTTGAFTHNEYRPADNLMLVDLTGVSAGQLQERMRNLDAASVKSYRVLTYTGTSGTEVTRVELALVPGAAVEVDKKDADLTLKISGGEVAAAAPVRAPAAAPVAPAPVATATAAPAANTTPVMIRQVNVTRGANGMEVAISPRTAAAPITQTLSGPDRLVIDLPNAIPAVRTKQIAVNSSDIKGVRISRYQENPPVTRIVVDMTSAHDFQLVPGEKELVVKLTPSMAKAAPAPVVESKPAATEVAKADAPAAIPAAAPAATDTKPTATPAPSFVMVDAQNPVNVPKPAPAVRSLEAASVMATTIAKDKVDNVLPPTASEAPAGAVNLAQEQQTQQHSAQPASGPRYTGEPISVNLKDVDLKDFFRLIHEISGLNVVLDPSVKGTVTLVLDDVPWDQALDIVLRNNGLDRQLDGNVLRIASIETLRTEAVARRQQLEAQALAVDKVTVTRFLSYARSADLVPTLKKFLSARGDIIADGRMNALVISDIPGVIPSLDRLISQLDRKTQEVEIEARVVAATRTFVRELGIQLGGGWGGASTSVSGNPNAGFGSTNFKNPAGQPITGAPFPISTTGAFPLFTNFQVLNPTAGLELINIGHSYGLDLYLSAAEQRGLLKILSRPRVVTQNNVTALVRQGFRLPVVTLSQLNGPPTVTYVDAFLRLTVTPQITVENTIFLAVDVENTTPDFTRTVLGNPILLTQQTTTQVLVTDGGTVTIGGVVQTQNTLTSQEVPILGDIPILKYLFMHKTTNTQTQELIFFITPKIVQT